MLKREVAGAVHGSSRTEDSRRHALTRALGPGAFVLTALMVSGGAGALPMVNGNIEMGEYDQSFQVGWANAHAPDFSQFNEAKGLKTTAYYTFQGGMLWLGLAAPVEARSMIWGAGVSAANKLALYQHWCSPKSGGSAPIAGGSDCDHHKDGIDKLKIDFKTMTGSEKLEIGDFKADLADLKANDLDISEIVGSVSGALVEFKDSVDYVVAAKGCTATDSGSCGETTVPITFELKYSDITEGEKDLVIAALSNTLHEYHLSPEWGVPEPGTALLLATGLMGLAMRSRGVGKGATEH